jgi:aspartyl-tRNA(Asn)/glutamyl-tRNA(Gln) amidotransferase subunit C
MSISKEDVKKLADLARIEMKEGEMEELSKEMDSILGYVSQVQEVAGESVDDVEVGFVRNVMREDENPTEGGTNSKEIITEFPNKEGDFLKVKKIL